MLLPFYSLLGVSMGEVHRLILSIFIDPFYSLLGVSLRQGRFGLGKLRSKSLSTPFWEFRS